MPAPDPDPAHPHTALRAYFLSPQAQFRTSRGSQHLIEPDDAAAYYGPCPRPPGPCARPRGINLNTDLFNMTPYHRFKDNYRYKGGWRFGLLWAPARVWEPADVAHLVLWG